MHLLWSLRCAGRITIVYGGYFEVYACAVSAAPSPEFLGSLVKEGCRTRWVVWL